MNSESPSPEINLAHSPACERNKEPILDILKSFIQSDSHPSTFLEIGHGTGQHACHFSKSLSHLNYIAADQKQYHSAFQSRIDHLGKPDNLDGPYRFQVKEEEVRHNLPLQEYDYIFTANTLHIMSWSEAQCLLKEMRNLLKKDGLLFIYGPFKFEGEFTSASNASFDHNLKNENPEMGIRDFESIQELLGKKYIEKVEKIDMPANNHILIFKRNK